MGKIFHALLDGEIIDAVNAIDHERQRYECLCCHAQIQPVRFEQDFFFEHPSREQCPCDKNSYQQHLLVRLLHNMQEIFLPECPSDHGDSKVNDWEVLVRPGVYKILEHVHESRIVQQYEFDALILTSIGPVFILLGQDHDEDIYRQGIGGLYIPVLGIDIENESIQQRSAQIINSLQTKPDWKRWIYHPGVQQSQRR